VPVPHIYICACARLVLFNEKERNKRANVINISYQQQKKKKRKKVVTRHSRLIDLLQFVRHDKNDLTDNIYTYIHTYFFMTTTGACRIHTREKYCFIKKKAKKKNEANISLDLPFCM
jgi:hypothetical protein